MTPKEKESLLAAREIMQRELAALQGGIHAIDRILTPASGKHSMTAEGRAAIAAAQKRRWAEARANGPKE